MRGIDRLIEITTFTAINAKLKISIIEFNPKAHLFGFIDGWYLDQANLERPNFRNRGVAWAVVALGRVKAAQVRFCDTPTNQFFSIRVPLLHRQAIVQL